ncbi:hypothetical protein KIPE111705_12640 [Kibdelosporangium persicum]|uniref:hypothetical protein n=1 Tax=Kibdelosporangium persicum TaxID=2698649 RepID=UPI0015639709|nr:hypothetical protein [Kibdelosporangium persicum]
MSTTVFQQSSSADTSPQSTPAGEKSQAGLSPVKLFALVPAVALAAAVPLAWVWGLAWTGMVLAVFFSTLTSQGVTIGSHRYLTRELPATGAAVDGPVLAQLPPHRPPA